MGQPFPRWCQRSEKNGRKVGTLAGVLFFIPLVRFKLYHNDTFLMASGISINPRSWCHQCTNIDTRSGIILMIYEWLIIQLCKGNIIIIVNGKILIDEVISFFINSYDVRPLSLQGRKYFGLCRSNFYINIIRETDPWKITSDINLVSISGRRFKFECIRVAINSSQTSHKWHLSTYIDWLLKMKWRDLQDLRIVQK